MRKVVGKVNEAELTSITLIRNRVTCATQALKASNIFEGATEAQCSQFLRGVIDALADYQRLEEEWWAQMILKYSLEGVVWVDFSSGELYLNEEK